MIPGRMLQISKDKTELFTKAQNVITTDHAYIHQGLGFAVSKSVSLGGSAVYYIEFTTPEDLLECHLRPESFSSISSPIKIDFYEGAVLTSGAAETPINRNRISSNTSDSTIKSNSSLTSLGNLLFSVATGSGGNTRNRQGGSGGEAQEYVLKKDTTYLYRITNLTSTDTEIFLNLFWYEESEQ